MGQCVEVYVDDMVVKSPSHHQHAQDLSAVFSALRQYNFRLNPDMCVFGVDRGKFLRFMLTQRGIEANPEKCNAIIEMHSPTTIKEVQRLIGRLTAISRFLPKLAEQTQPIVQLLKKSARFTWMDDYEQIFQKLKTTLTSPPILHKSDTRQPLLVYITATDHTINVALVKDIEGAQHLVTLLAEGYRILKPDIKWWKSWSCPWSTQLAACTHTSKTTTSPSKPTTQSRRYCKNQTWQDGCHPGPSSCRNSTFVTNPMAPFKLVPPRFY